MEIGQCMGLASPMVSGWYVGLASPTEMYWVLVLAGMHTIWIMSLFYLFSHLNTQLSYKLFKRVTVARQQSPNITYPCTWPVSQRKSVPVGNVNTGPFITTEIFTLFRQSIVSIVTHEPNTLISIIPTFFIASCVILFSGMVTSARISSASTPKQLPTFGIGITTWSWIKESKEIGPVAVKS